MYCCPPPPCCIGPQGPRGWPGPIGPTGWQGDQGQVGPAGPQGPQGPPEPIPGPQGNLGPQGPVGPTGDPSQEPGFAGDTGNTGPVGPDGPQGPQGPQGIVGPDGFPGDTGPTGLTGFSNVTGATGETGATGAVVTVPGVLVIHTTGQTITLPTIGSTGFFMPNTVLANVGFAVGVPSPGYVTPPAGLFRVVFELGPYTLTGGSAFLQIVDTSNVVYASYELSVALSATQLHAFVADIQQPGGVSIGVQLVSASLNPVTYTSTSTATTPQSFAVYYIGP